MDLLVVSGCDVLLFPDKRSGFCLGVKIKVTWSRWHELAIVKSARWLAGAESFLRRFRDRVLVDTSCQTKFPLALLLRVGGGREPPTDIYIYIYITRAIGAAAQRH